MLKNVCVASHLKTGATTIVHNGDPEWWDECCNGFNADFVNLCSESIFVMGHGEVPSDYIKSESLLDQVKKYHNAVIVLDKEDVDSELFYASQPETIFNVAQKNNLVFIQKEKEMDMDNYRAHDEFGNIDW